MLLKRIGYFLVGVSISSIGVYFFWQKKNATFDYGMDARTLKTIRIKKRFYSEDAKKVMLNSDIDTLKIATILYNGDVDFGNSKPRQKPCAEYYITGKRELENVSLYVSRCDSTATIEKIILD
ncbi:hypothetical protein BW723_15320 [Polaribacter reichenbachii]|uniref:DUF4258 domain-containing protein n=1 Tax=Polaribacter reichenbachii TaxID=996801 RepID=A0A1B8U5D6_9FLAO|nr:DUF4258 domain-containing protein [Polaribacter reichenbachii]APZ47569.1 hypothetical protein BW723_15320 [Polaribacter reichenbachii]AUC18209.1 hypothetical protein BTO17_05765 [Polaribacter reichenbachii]OBY67078.1 hypothetical protein LPB301_04470 [Polaribacter reichenbachii]